MRAQAAIPLFEGISNSVPICRADVGDVYVELIPALWVEEARVACRGELPLTRVDEVENEYLVSPMPEESKSRPRGLRVHEEVGQQDYEPSATQSDGDVTERRVSRCAALSLERRQPAEELVPGTWSPLRGHTRDDFVVERSHTYRVALTQENK